jgi:hypothetical protein
MHNCSLVSIRRLRDNQKHLVITVNRLLRSKTLTSRTRLLEKLTVAHTLKKLLDFYRTQGFISVRTKAQRCNQSGAKDSPDDGGSELLPNPEYSSYLHGRNLLGGGGGGGEPLVGFLKKILQPGKQEMGTVFF